MIPPVCESKGARVTVQQTAKQKLRAVKQRSGKLIDPAAYTPFFTYRNPGLYCEDVALSAVAAAKGTPVYVYSRAAIEAAYLRFTRAFRSIPHSICYSVKANSNPSILRILARLGSRFDIVSGGELYILQETGIGGGRIVFSGVGKTREEIREALRANILLFNVESEQELDAVMEEASRARRVASVALRVNPDVEAHTHPHISTGHHRHKFGVDWQDARRLYVKWNGARWIQWRGISAHIGSQIQDGAAFRAAANRMASFVKEVARAGVHLEFFDFGGGLGIRYTNERVPEMRNYAATLIRAVKPLGCHLLLEPGRAIVGAAGVLLTRVIYTKRTRGKGFVVVDAAMNDMIRPALYDAVHPITPVRPATSNGNHRFDIVGPVCESGDSFLKDWPMPEVASGDLLVLWGAGAYGYCMASQYNSRPRATEVLVHGGQFKVIRRRESRKDLIRGE